ncbi:MAG: hypothetical protein PHY47_25580 [Lachnospiraceae bacterium]|nr:hypothetical protein [Lachnospiraceae bacterium]
MTRTIYQFYCYKCFNFNVSETTYNLDIRNNLIEHIFCPNCHAWVLCSDTNLSPAQYKIINKGNWSIIDEDSPNNSTIYINKKYQSALKVCDQLNANKITISDIHDSYCTLETIDWFLTLL